MINDVMGCLVSIPTIGVIPRWMVRRPSNHGYGNTVQGKLIARTALDNMIEDLKHDNNRT